VERIGKYEVRRALGRGAIGAVFEAVDPETGLEVAVKAVTTPNAAADSKQRQRFLETVRAVAELEHPNLVRILEVGDHEERPFVVMDLVKGVDLGQVIGSKRSFPLEWTLDLFRQMCEGLAHAHRNGILHLDLKPADIRVTAQGELKILDFGAAHLKKFDRLESGPARGGVFYRAPEQIEGRRPNGRADVFSVGAIVYELVTRRKPFPAEDTPTVLFKITHDRPDARAFPETVFSPGLEAIVVKALSRDPRERYLSLEEMHEALVKVVQEAAPRLRALAPPPPPAPEEPVLAAEERPGAAKEPVPRAAEAAVPAAAATPSPEPHAPPSPTATPAPAPPAADERESLREELTRWRAEGQLPRALAICDRLIELDPEDEAVRRTATEIESLLRDREVERLCSVALAHAADGDLARAAELAEKVERLSPWSPRYLQLQIYLDEETARLNAAALVARAREQQSAGNLEEAWAAAQEALIVDPASVPARRILEEVARLREPVPETAPADAPNDAPPAGAEAVPMADPAPSPAGVPVAASSWSVAEREAEIETLTSVALNHFVHNDHPRARQAVEEALALDPYNRRALELLKILGSLD
jgi:serine/threonine-protein kinase